MTCKIFLTSIFLSQMFTAAFAIKCYQCNSAIDEECHNLSLFKPHLTAGFYKECTDFQIYNGSTPFCRKTQLTIKYADNLKRTIRSCGWLNPESSKECYRADNGDHLEIRCQCFEDGCNESSQVKIVSILTLIVVNICLFVTWH